jgi:hypothetical protein
MRFDHRKTNEKYLYIMPRQKTFTENKWQYVNIMLSRATVTENPCRA